jgi:effector-binding domain-containing protein
MSDIEMRETPVQHTAVVRVTTTTDRISHAMGGAFEKVFAALGKAGVAPSGPAITKYTHYSEQEVTFEAGVPVAAPFPGDGDVVAGEIGGCTAAVTTHVGPYSGLAETYGKLQAWMEAAGHKPSMMMWEAYQNDPDTTEPQQLRTEIFWPVGESC